MKRFTAAALVLMTLLTIGCNVKEPQNTPTATSTDTVQTTTPSPDIEPTEEPTPTIEPTPNYEVYHVKAHNLNVRSKPDASDNTNIIGELHAYDEVCVTGTEGEFARMLLTSGEEAYCASKYLVPIDEKIYAYIAPFEDQKIDIKTGEPVFDPEGNPVMVKCELVDLRYLLPDAEFELLFATERNVTGSPLYPYAIPMIQKDTGKKLVKAFEKFREDGYTMKFYDAYRPLSVQRVLYDIVQVPKWIADPSTTASNHNRGCAVDMSLIGPDGVELEFPTPMHTFAEESGRESTAWTEAQRANVDYMTDIMLNSGFDLIKGEWWHFADKVRKEFMTMDIPFTRFTLCTESELKELLG